MSQIPRYISNATFPPIAFGDVAKNARKFTAIGQKTVLIAHSQQTIYSAMIQAGFYASIKKLEIPYHYEVTSTGIAANTLQKKSEYNKKYYAQKKARENVLNPTTFRVVGV